MDSNNGNSAVATMPEPKTYSRHPLSPKQQDFFRQNRMAIQQIEVGMRGALQLIVTEQELKGKVTLSDDFSELIIEAE